MDINVFVEHKINEAKEADLVQYVEDGQGASCNGDIGEKGKDQMTTEEVNDVPAEEVIEGLGEEVNEGIGE